MAKQKSGKCRAPCPRCGARTTKDAERLCQPTQIADTGDYDCPGEDEDKEGFILQPTPETLAAQDAAIEDWADHERAIEATMQEIDPECWNDADRWQSAREKAEAKLAAATA